MQELVDLSTKSRELDVNKADFVRGTEEVMFNDHGDLQVMTASMSVDEGHAYEEAGKTLTPSDWALQQICDKLGPPPAKYIRVCPPWLLALNLNHWREAADKRLLLRAYKDTLRGVLSDKYVPLSNTWILETLQELLGDVSYKITHSVLDPNQLHVKIMVLSTEDGEYGMGAYIANGEIGNSMIRVLPFIQRNACVNSILFMDGAYEQRHINVTQAFMRAALKEKVGQAFQLAREYIDEVVRAEEDDIPSLSDVIVSLCERYKYDETVQANILMGTEGQETRMGLVNGLSWAAQRENIDQEIQMETLAGSFLRRSTFAPGPGVLHDDT